jgi:hypothetical protein
VERYGFEQVRELVVEGYRLQYHVGPDGVEVLAVFP